MKNDGLYLCAAGATLIVLVIFYKQHHRRVIERIKEKTLDKKQTNGNVQPQPQMIQPILINAPASMFQLPVDRNNAVIVPVNLPPGVTPAVI